MGVEAAIEQNPVQDKTALRLNEAVGFEGMRVDYPARDLAVITSIDMTALDQILDKGASGTLAAGSRNRTNADRCGRGDQPPRFRCRPDEKRDIPEPVVCACQCQMG